MKTPTKASFSEGYSEDGTCRALGRSDQGVAEELDMAGGGEGRRYIQEKALGVRWRGERDVGGL